MKISVSTIAVVSAIAAFSSTVHGSHHHTRFHFDQHDEDAFLSKVRGESYTAADTYMGPARSMSSMSSKSSSSKGMRLGEPARSEGLTMSAMSAMGQSSSDDSYRKTLGRDPTRTGTTEAKDLDSEDLYRSGAKYPNERFSDFDAEAWDNYRTIKGGEFLDRRKRMGMSMSTNSNSYSYYAYSGSDSSSSSSGSTSSGSKSMMGMRAYGEFWDRFDRKGMGMSMSTNSNSNSNSYSYYAYSGSDSSSSSSGSSSSGSTSNGSKSKSMMGMRADGDDWDDFYRKGMESKSDSKSMKSTSSSSRSDSYRGMNSGNSDDEDFAELCTVLYVAGVTYCTDDRNSDLKDLCGDLEDLLNYEC